MRPRPPSGRSVRLRELLAHPKVLAIGEIGLDYHYDFSSARRAARHLHRQLQYRRDAGKPIVIHTREAWDDTLAICANTGAAAGGIMHCFTGGAAQARQALDLGFHLSFGGVAHVSEGEQRAGSRAADAGRSPAGRNRLRPTSRPSPIAASATSLPL